MSFFTSISFLGSSKMLLLRSKPQSSGLILDLFPCWSVWRVSNTSTSFNLFSVLLLFLHYSYLPITCCADPRTPDVFRFLLWSCLLTPLVLLKLTHLLIDFAFKLACAFNISCIIGTSPFQGCLPLFVRNYFCQAGLHVIFVEVWSSSLWLLDQSGLTCQSDLCKQPLHYLDSKNALNWTWYCGEVIQFLIQRISLGVLSFYGLGNVLKIFLSAPRLPFVNL